MFFDPTNCPYCMEEIESNELLKHLKIHIKQDNLICPVCSGAKRAKNATCSRSCANTFFRSGENSGAFRNGRNNYRTICFLYHPKECIICKENRIIDVHHFNNVHTDNEPSNLVPLCPTHHRCYHSLFRSDVEQLIIEYREQFLERSIELL